MKSQINEHDKLLLLALALPQVAKWHCLTLYAESLVGPPNPSLTPPTLSLSIDLGQPL